jgi:glyoxylase-like metal-dependent hydrolase (beta-lactamase superfamily II)
MTTRILMEVQHVAENWFGRERIRDDLYLIFERHYRWLSRANIWLVTGRDANLLIDTGLGVASLKSYLAHLLEKPLIVIASHVHFDHAGGCHEFEDVRIHVAEHEALCHANQDEMLATAKHAFVRQADFEQLPAAAFSAAEYSVQPCPQAKQLQHGDIIDLGDKAFEILHLPGHSPGSIGLLDATAGRLFSGDVVYDGELLDELELSVIDDYVRSMQQLLKIPIEEVRPGHYQSFDRRRLQSLVRRYIDSRQAPRCPADAGA